MQFWAEEIREQHHHRVLLLGLGHLGSAFLRSVTVSAGSFGTLPSSGKAWSARQGFRPCFAFCRGDVCTGGIKRLVACWVSRLPALGSQVRRSQCGSLAMTLPGQGHLGFGQADFAVWVVGRSCKLAHLSRFDLRPEAVKAIPRRAATSPRARISSASTATASRWRATTNTRQERAVNFSGL